jgi:hypothetical protein
MENRKIEIKWAIIFTFATLLWMLFEKIMGLHSDKIADHATVSNFFGIVAIVVYVFALLDKRNSTYAGFMTWKQGFLSGVVLSLFVSVLSLLATLVGHMVISPEYFPNVIAYTVESEQFTRQEAEEYFTMTNYLIQSAIFSFVVGVVTAAIVSLFVQKKPKGGLL